MSVFDRGLAGPAPFRLFLALLLVIFATEAVVMSVLDDLLRDLDWTVVAVVDAGVLTAVCVPFVWMLFVRPLSQADAHARALLDSIPDTALLMTPGGRVLAANRPAADLLGETPARLRGRDVLAMLPPEMAADRRRRIAEIERGGSGQDFAETRGGRDWLVRMVPVHGAVGELAALAVHKTDVTERNRRRAVADFLAQLDARVVEGDVAGLLDFACERVVTLFDLPLACIGRRMPDGSVSVAACAGEERGYIDEMRAIGVRWDEGDTASGPVGTAIRTGQPRFARMDGNDTLAPWREAAAGHRLRAVHAFPLTIHGKVEGAFGVWSRRAEQLEAEDVAQPLEAVVRRIRVALGLAADQARLKLLGTALTVAGNGIFITDRSGRIEWANPAFGHLSGLDPEALVGQRPSLWKSGHHGDDYYDRLWRTILDGEVWCEETIERHADGSLFTVLQTITPIRNDAGEVAHFVSIHEDITVQKLAEARVKRMAHYDTLTDLPNRVLFFDRLRQAVAIAQRESHPLALLFLDLDRFKQVNDSLGHHVGDLLLQEAARRMREVVRASDTVARLAGDEFTVILPHVVGRDDAATVAEKIIEAINRPFHLQGHEVRVGTSIGIALYPVDSMDEDALVTLADAAMYDAKREQRNAYRFAKVA
ncbi:MAG: diguanylate cyclase [Pseudomonadota bacterium]